MHCRSEIHGTRSVWSTHNKHDGHDQRGTRRQDLREGRMKRGAARIRTHSLSGH